MSAAHLDINILDNLTTAIVVVRPDLTVSYINTAAEVLLEISGRRVIGEAIDSLFTELDSSDNGLLQAIHSYSTCTKREAKLQLNNRSLITVDCVVTPTYEQEQISALIVELQPLDLVLRINREEALLATQENAHTLVKGMAHEIKNPLGGLRGAAQLLAKQLPSNELQDYTNIIIDEADRLTKLVDRMLGSNTLPKLQAINIHEILEHVKQLIDAETNQQIALLRDYDPSTPDITGDKEQLIQAVLNVARNAMQALQRQSQPTQPPQITFKTRVLRQFTLGSHRHRLVCHVEIIDNGPGIAEPLLSRIFLPMVSGQANGTGLGLSLAQTIINQHKGLIECHSQAGETVFSLYIPIAPTASQGDTK
ncbi:nitrogen regulation protein NR(II) [Dasania sp. GY-MA-18]|uniref:Sensory histidine kinase/phosphatase NtrB n=1 Tax=Dasania phycosphaerae TaxID=2950436 RepID=A0A9J6RM08_9GAMM|nr:MULTISPECIES: nitrogen regulation protein NR(II) [Dasania]MCR8923060.1 nitrogen regulation protein NR(II) [Dasania sp. GY-MA-18]MCZ0865492.1 nitrogen regulation protein NR(II) [Dasania phycosphaerae]MCZ0869217.1 nitrogen regulation protein NR(II) [Dasania phycosphaerae]